MTVRIALIGDFHPTYPSHRELEAARRLLGPDVETTWVPTDSPEMAAIASGATAYDGVWICPGSPYADDTAVLAVIRYARESGLPLLGTCGGLQYAVLEFLRDGLGVGATHAEVDAPGPDHAIAELPCSLRGEQRVVTPVVGTAFAALTGGRPFVGMHYCGYGPTPSTVTLLTRHGWIVEATAPDAPVEVLTYMPHPFFVLTLFQPQIGAVDHGQVHPLVHAFVDVCRRVAPVRAATLERARAALVDAQPRPYPHQLRGAAHRWWRPLLTLVLALVLWFVLAILISLPFVVTGSVPTTGTFELGVASNLMLNLSLAALIPAGLLAVRLGSRRPAGRLLSITGRLRWRWLLQSLALVTPLWVAYLTISWFAFDQEVLPRPKDWVGLLVVTALTTPLQAAGEEVGFRGVLVQTVGAWFRRPWVALAVSTALSFGAFAAAHGSMDPWIWLDLGSLALAGCWLSWRSGGLEAAMALHIVNNLTVTFSGIWFGGLEQSYVSTDTTGSPVSAAMSLAVMALATALLDWRARRAGLAPQHWRAPTVG